MLLKAMVELKDWCKTSQLSHMWCWPIPTFQILFGPRPCTTVSGRATDFRRKASITNYQSNCGNLMPTLSNLSNYQHLVSHNLLLFIDRLRPQIASRLHALSTSCSLVWKATNIFVKPSTPPHWSFKLAVWQISGHVVLISTILSRH